MRDEHRQTLEWLNERTDTNTQFFGITIEVFKIDDSKPAFKFVPVVFPNEWHRISKESTINTLSPRAELYREYFQKLIDKLRDDHHFTRARMAQPQSWYTFPTGVTGVLYGMSFAQNNRVRVDLYIDFGRLEDNKSFFDNLFNKKQRIEQAYGGELSWERLDERRASRIAIYREGSINVEENSINEIFQWSINNLLRFKETFTNYIRTNNK